MDLRQMAEKRADAKIEFQENLYKYLIVNVIIGIICLLFLQSFWLLFFVMFFWGIDVVDKFFKAYPLSDCRENMIEKNFQKWVNKMSDNIRTRAEERVEKKIKFYRNLQAYLIVNAFLAVINWFFTPEFWWVLFPVFFWGIGVFKDFLIAYVFVDKFSDDYRERKIQEEMQKLRD